MVAVLLEARAFRAFIDPDTAATSGVQFKLVSPSTLGVRTRKFRSRLSRASSF
jgi:hypothetical protein